MVLKLGSIEPLGFGGVDLRGSAEQVKKKKKKHNYLRHEFEKKKIIFHFSLKRGSVDPHMKLVGFGTSNKV